MRGNSHVRFGEEPRGDDPHRGTAPRGLLYPRAVCPGQNAALGGHPA